MFWKRWTALFGGLFRIGTGRRARSRGAVAILGDGFEAWAAAALLARAGRAVTLIHSGDTAARPALLRRLSPAILPLLSGVGLAPLSGTATETSDGWTWTPGERDAMQAALADLSPIDAARLADLRPARRATLSASLKTIQSPRLRNHAIAATLAGTGLAPEDFGSASLLRAALDSASHLAVAGGEEALREVFAAIILGHGGAVRGDRDGALVQIKRDAAAGVVVAGGVLIDADSVLVFGRRCVADLKLVGADGAPLPLRNLPTPPLMGLARLTFRCAVRPAFGNIDAEARVVLNADPQAAARARADGVRGRLPEPALVEILTEPAPDGFVVTVTVPAIPWTPEQGVWTQSLKSALADAVAATIERASAGFAASVTAVDVDAPDEWDAGEASRVEPAFYASLPAGLFCISRTVADGAAAAAALRWLSGVRS